MNNKGFSLIELLIAIAIFGILLTALTAFFISQNRQYVVQSEIVAMQDNARAAIDFVVRSIRNSSIYSSDPYGDVDGCDHEIKTISYISNRKEVTDQNTIDNIINDLNDNSSTNVSADDLNNFIIDTFGLEQNPDPTFSVTNLSSNEWDISGQAWWVISEDKNEAKRHFFVNHNSGKIQIFESGMHEFRIYSSQTDGPYTFGYNSNPVTGNIAPFALNVICFEVYKEQRQFKIKITAETERDLPGTGEPGSTTLQSTVKPRNLN